MNTVVSVASLASAAAVASPSIADERSAADIRLEDLWRRRLDCVKKYRAASTKLDAAEKSLPDWVLMGPQFKYEDSGQEDGNVGWPRALEVEGDYGHPICTGGKVAWVQRPQLATIKELFRQRCEFAPERRIEWREDFRYHVRQLVARLRRARKLKQDAGVIALNDEMEKEIEKSLDLKDEIAALDAVPNVTAAVILIEMLLEATFTDTLSQPNDGTLQIASAVLEHLQPHLSGEIATATAEFLHNPEQPVGYLSFSETPREWLDTRLAA